MFAYKRYFDRQTVSPQAHDRLMALGQAAMKKETVPARPTETEQTAAGRKTAPVRPIEAGQAAEKKTLPARRRWGAAAACAALLLGAGIWHYAGQPAPVEPMASQTPAVSPAVSPTEDPDGLGGKVPAPHVPVLDYTDVTQELEVAASIALPDGAFRISYGEGAFDRELTLQDLQTIFWGAEGKPQASHPKLEQGDFPAVLRWDDYTITASAIYDGEGRLWELLIYGEGADDNSFSLTLCPGMLPPTCLAEPGEEASSYNGVPVSLWRRSYDCDGDGEIEHICIAEFMAGDIGVRFRNIDGPFRSEYGGEENMELGGAMEFNAALVTLALGENGLTLDHLMVCEDVPAWEETSFETLAQARQRAQFAPYLPAEDVPGYASFAGNKEFYGHYSYQEGSQNLLWVLWSHNYDDVSVSVWLPEGEGILRQPVDVNVPESYDWRLYDGPISQSVPKEYRENFYMPAFRAEDMSLEVVKARGREKDTGGAAYRFYVLHENGVVVEYDCSAVTAEQVWAMVQATLPAVPDTDGKGGAADAAPETVPADTLGSSGEPEICALPLAPADYSVGEPNWEEQETKQS